MTTTPNIHPPLRNVRIDRPHRFAVGDIIHHVDDPHNDPESPGAEIRELTYRVRDGVAYPTYTLSDRGAYADSTTYDDILCTRDLEDRS